MSKSQDDKRRSDKATDIDTSRVRALNHRKPVPGTLIRSGCARVLVDDMADEIDRLRRAQRPSDAKERCLGNCGHYMCNHWCVEAAGHPSPCRYVGPPLDPDACCEARKVGAPFHSDDCPTKADLTRADASGTPLTTGRRQEVIEQLCKMMGRAWQTIDPNAHNASDCVCRSNVVNEGDKYRNAGHALTFMEEAISVAIAKHEKKVCPDCDQPMLPPGEVKRPNEYDHASGCPRSADDRYERERPQTLVTPEQVKDPCPADAPNAVGSDLSEASGNTRDGEGTCSPQAATKARSSGSSAGTDAENTGAVPASPGAPPGDTGHCANCDELPAVLCRPCVRQQIEEAVDSYIDSHGNEHCFGCIHAKGARKCPGIPRREEEQRSADDPHRFEVGDIVKHKTYGRGTVTEILGDLIRARQSGLELWDRRLCTLVERPAVKKSPERVWLIGHKAWNDGDRELATKESQAKSYAEDPSYSVVEYVRADRRERATDPALCDVHECGRCGSQWKPNRVEP